MSKIYINMTICGEVEASTLGSFLSQVSSEASIFSTGAAAAETTSTEAPKTTTRTRKPAEPAAESGKGAEVKGADVAGEEVDEVPSADDVAAAAKVLNAKNGRDALVEMLGKYDAKQLSGIAETDRAAFIAACEAAVS